MCTITALVSKVWLIKTNKEPLLLLQLLNEVQPLAIVTVLRVEEHNLWVMSSTKGLKTS